MIIIMMMIIYSIIKIDQNTKEVSSCYIVIYSDTTIKTQEGLL